MPPAAQDQDDFDCCKAMQAEEWEVLEVSHNRVLCRHYRLKYGSLYILSALLVITRADRSNSRFALTWVTHER